VLEAALVSLQVVEEHADNANDFLLIEVIQDFGNGLNDAELVVSKAVHGEWMIGNNPKSSNHVVSNLSCVCANLSISSSSAIVLQ